MWALRLDILAVLDCYSMLSIESMAANVFTSLTDVLSKNQSQILKIALNIVPVAACVADNVL